MEPHPSVATLTVKDTLITGTKQWDTIFIHSLLPPELAMIVCSTPLIDSVTHDKPVWTLTTHGNYSIKTAYRSYMSKTATIQNLGCVGDWSIIWSL